MNVNKTPVNNAANMSMFMVNVSAKLMEKYRCQNPEYSVLDLKSHYNGHLLDTDFGVTYSYPENLIILEILVQTISLQAKISMRRCCFLFANPHLNCGEDGV